MDNGKDLPTDFADGQPEASGTTADSGKDADGIPYCRVHHCRMKRYSGGKKGSPTIYYKCAVKECNCTAQIVKTRREGVVPPTPVCCPRCSTSKAPVVCERNDALSRATCVIVQCPSCGWKSGAMALPQLAAQHGDGRLRKPEASLLGDR